MNPVISVIIPTYNRPDMLKEALKSVLSQTYQNFEIIVVNDAGEDVKAVIDALNYDGKIVYIKHKDNRGLSAARNTGLKVARGTYIAYLDDDDIYYPNHLETLEGFLETSNYKVAYTDAYQAFQTWITDKYVTTEKKVTYRFDFDRNRFLVCNYIHISTIIHRKNLLDEVGFFDESLDVHEDWEFCIRLSQYCDFYHIKSITTEFRTRNDGTNMTTSEHLPFLKTLRLIHSRYSHLVTDNCILEDQKRVEKSLTREVEIETSNSSIKHYEHLHRYRLAKEFVKDKDVLVLVCGDGYGSFVISEEAKSVTGFGMDAASIRLASSRYVKENLKFIKGSITYIPIKEEKMFDVIICFETLENAEDYNALMKEVKRLIKDDGIFMVSIFNRNIYLDQSNNERSFYPRKFYLDELKALLTGNFKNILIYGQKVFPSSNIFPLSKNEGHIKDFAIEKGENEFLFVPPEKKEARHFIAISSDSPIKETTGNSYLVDLSETFFRQKDTHIDNLETVIKERDAHINNLESAIRDKDTFIGGLESAIKEGNTHINNLESAIRDKDTFIGGLESAIKEGNAHINNLESAIREKDTTLNNIYNSRGWKTLLFYYKIRNKLLPEGTRRRNLIKLILRPSIFLIRNNLLYKGFKTLKEEGMISFIEKGYRKISLIAINKKDNMKLKYLSLRSKKIKKLHKHENLKVLPIQMNLLKSKLVACTIVSKNYLSYAITLGRSFKSHNPNFDFRILLCDLLEDKEDIRLSLNLQQEGLLLIPIYEIKNYIEIPDLEAMLFKYTIIEINTAIKPFFLEYLLRSGYEKVIYFDPDVFIMNDINEIEKLLDGYNIILTPHILENIPDDAKKPSNLDILNAGVYNLGFIAIKDSEETKRSLKWWQEKLIDGCFMDVEKGFHVDQKWIDFLPVLFKNVYIQNKKTYNMAYWNLHEREIIFRDGNWYVGDEHILFFHFSGFVIGNLDKISKHQNRFCLKNFPHLKELFKLYRNELLKNDLINIGNKQYYFEKLPGTTIKIPDFMRQMHKQILSKIDNPWNPDSVMDICNFVNKEVYPPITRLLFSMYNSRNDLQRIFPLIESLPDNREKFYKWVWESGKKEYDLSRIFFDPANVNKKDYTLDNKHGVNLWGYFEVLMGISELSRCLLDAFRQTGIPLTLINIPSECHENVNPEKIQHLNKYFTQNNIYKINLITANADQLPHIYEHFGHVKFKDKYNIGFWAWEIQGYFPFKASFDLVDEVWSFSDFACHTYRKYTHKPVTKILYPFKSNWNYIIEPEVVRKRYNISEEDFAFIFSFDFHSSFERKNPDGIINAFLKAFEKDKKAKLIIKSIHSQYHSTNQKYIKNLINNSGNGNIIYIDKGFSREDYISLVNASDCFVSLHRSEGLGIGILEAMCLGKCVIVTKYGGNMEFTTSENSLLVDYKLTPIKQDFGPYKKGELWAEPNIDQCVEYMRTVYENRETAKTMGEKASNYVKNISSMATYDINRRLLEI
ncbi:MAG: glycosyltransferase [Candidatus Scalinduaceae bacterium]